MAWPPGQPTSLSFGRLVLNTNVHGVPFNTATGKAALAKFLDALHANPAAVFPPRAFGRMVLNTGSGLRLVNDAAYPCTCESVWGQGAWMWCCPAAALHKGQQGRAQGEPPLPAMPLLAAK